MPAEKPATAEAGDTDAERSPNREFAIGLARAFAGAVIFALPLLMTMEMWAFGFTLAPYRLMVFIVLTIPLLVGMAHFLGFEPTFDAQEDVVDAFVAYAVAFIAAAFVLLLLGVIQPGMSGREIVGKIALQAIPGAIGALLAQSQLGMENEEQKSRERNAGYFGELFFMAVGALFFAFNLAPTEEIILTAFHLSGLSALVLALVSLVIMHAFVYAVNFSGQASIPADKPAWLVFLRYTVVGYALVLLISLFVLWAFGRTENNSLYENALSVVVLGLPGAIGAAAARLIL
ncbi:MAG: TIGR02587 family membrane protein [Chloroflexota bacterium]|nr:MAG: TIGR02587 family membrane protein [Chloroflexota bacterium]